MAEISINNKLTNFAQRELVMAYSSDERAKIQSSLAHLTSVLKSSFAGQIQDVQTFGSYTRNTILPRKHDANSDVDILIIFNQDTYSRTPGTYRERIKLALKTAYPRAVIKKDFPTVRVEFNYIMYDLVPCIIYRTWASNEYKIPSKNDGWQTTNPNDLNQALARKNQGYGSNIARNVIRLIKHWNASAGYVYDSYSMEKWIIERHFYSNDNLYAKFLSVLWDLAARDHAGTKQAIQYIKQYQGDYWNAPNQAKEIQWLQKLLPGLII